MRWEKRTVEQRFMSHVVKHGPDDCWEWDGAHDTRGYGRFTIKTTRPQKSIAAHRYYYQLVNGPIDNKLVMDHLCRNIWCINPTHVEPVTQRENIMRGDGLAAKYSKKKICTRGHALPPPSPEKTGDYRRVCKKCAAIRNKIYYKQRKNGKKITARAGNAISHDSSA